MTHTSLVSYRNVRWI